MTEEQLEDWLFEIMDMTALTILATGCVSVVLMFSL